MVDENGVPIYAGYPGGSHSDAYDAPAPVEIDGYAIHELADTAGKSSISLGIYITNNELIFIYSTC